MMNARVSEPLNPKRLNIRIPQAPWRGGLWLGLAVNAEARVSARSWLVLELSGYQVGAGEVPVRGGAVYAATGIRWSL